LSDTGFTLQHHFQKQGAGRTAHAANANNKIL
jgi:hypothetical protein